MSNVTNLFKEAQRVLMLTSGGQESKHFVNILFNWKKIFEENIALSTSPVGIKDGKKGSVLEVSVFNNVVGAELYYRKREIISKINALLGKDVISDVMFTVKHKAVSLSKRSHESSHKIIEAQETKQINNEGLKESLNKLYSSIKERK